MEVLLPDILSAISNVSVWGSAIDYWLVFLSE
jgi:hypothetical protein